MMRAFAPQRGFRKAVEFLMRQRKQLLESCLVSVPQDNEPRQSSHLRHLRLIVLLPALG
jgi:hypothetical protein